MARQTDVSAVLKLADDIAKIGSEQIGEAVLRALNEGGDSAYELSRKTILRGINLTERYVQGRMEVQEATGRQPTFTITARGGKGFTTNLSHYGVMLEPKAVNWSNERIASMGKKFGKWPGWTYRKGDQARGIEEDEKQHIATVSVIKGSRKSAGRKFTLPGENDREGNPLLFQRFGGRIEPVQGPSVYQLFASTIPLIRDKVGDDLEQTLLREVEREVQKALG